MQNGTKRGGYAAGGMRSGVRLRPGYQRSLRTRVRTWSSSRQRLVHGHSPVSYLPAGVRSHRRAVLPPPALAGSRPEPLRLILLPAPVPGRKAGPGRCHGP
jgi:hypothetical protein